MQGIEPCASCSQSKHATVTLHPVVYYQNLLSNWWILGESNSLPIRAKDVLYQLTKDPECIFNNAYFVLIL